jgi:hypothetical protein
MLKPLSKDFDLKKQVLPPRVSNLYFKGANPDVILPGLRQLRITHGDPVHRWILELLQPKEGTLG